LLFLIDLAIGLYKIVISQQIKEVIEKTRCGSMPNVMVALPNIGGAEHRWRRLFNAAKFG